MFEQPQDFADESAALHALLAPLGEAALAERTAFKGWALTDIVGHLHFWNRAALLSLAEPGEFQALGAKVIGHLGAGGTLREFERSALDGLAGRTLVDTWHDFARMTAARFAEADPSARVPWVGPDMSVRSAMTARLMETWAHGQAAYDLFGVVRRNADRIRNIAVLGVNTYDWSFRVHGQKPPQPKPHLRLTAPSGALWTWNEPSETDLIEGLAEEFCQVVTQVRNIADTRLVVRGAAATAWVATAQCFAGPPETPPMPGARRTGARPAWAPA